MSVSGAPSDLPILLSIAGFPITTFDEGPLAYGTPITQADNTEPSTNFVFGDADPNPPLDVDYIGSWANQVGPAYIGATFTANSQQYLAWGEFQMDALAGTMTLLGYGYNDVPASQPGGALFAGQTPSRHP